MIRVLVIIAAAGAVISAMAFTGAVALGGTEPLRNGWLIADILDGMGDGHDSDLDHRWRDAPVARREMDWTGTDTLQVDLTAHVTYVQGPERTIVITGPEPLVNMVMVEGGRLREHEHSPGDLGRALRRGGKPIRVVITAPDVSRFLLNGSPDLDIRGYDKPSMTIRIAGGADVSASGRADRLDLDIAGSGDADLDGLSLTDAAVAIAGSGDATLGPVGSARVSIAGSGDVTLTRQPASLSSDVSGSGDISIRD